MFGPHESNNKYIGPRLLTYTGPILIVHLRGKFNCAEIFGAGAPTETPKITDYKSKNVSLTRWSPNFIID